MEIYVVRHGLSEGNEKMIFQGRIDFPLAPEGQNQATHLGRFFNERGIKFDRIVSSPMKRASETAELIRSQLQDAAEIEMEEAFIELRIGKLEGIKGSEVQEKFPTYYQRPPSGWLDFSEFGGESWEELQKRVDSAIPKYVVEDQLLNREKLLIVSHGGAMRAIMKNLLQIDSGFMYIRIENCCHFKINHVVTRGHLRRYIEYVMPLTSALVNGEPYQYDISDDQRAKSVS